MPFEAGTKMTRDEIMRSVSELAKRQAPPEHASAFDNPDAEFAEAGLGSLQIVELICAIEAKFGIEFPADDINAEIFRSARSVAERVDALRRQSQPIA